MVAGDRRPGIIVGQSGGPIPILGIDVGTGGTRAVVLDESGRSLASASEDHAAFASPQPGWAEQDPRDWWRATTIAVRKVLQAGNLSGASISCVGFSGQMHGAVLLNAACEVVRPALIWCDQRTQAQCEDLREIFGLSRLIELTCNPPLTNFTLTKMLWVRSNEPENWRRIRKVMLPKDYVRFRLTGDSATDVADGSGTLLLDVAKRTWSDEVLAKTEISPQILPKLYESQEVCGNISDSGAKETGLTRGTPVVAGAGDQAAGAVGIGITRPGTVSATIGTSGVVFAATDRPAFDPKGRLHTFCHAMCRYTVLTAPQPGEIGALSLPLAISRLFRLLNRGGFFGCCLLLRALFEFLLSPALFFHALFLESLQFLLALLKSNGHGASLSWMLAALTTQTRANGSVRVLDKHPELA